MSPTSPARIRSAAELRKVLGDFLAAIDADVDVGPRLRSGAAPLRLEFRHPDVAVTVTPAEGRGCLAWDFDPDSGVKPKLLLSMEAEFGNRLLQGRENPAIAIVRGRLRTRVEDAAAALRFFGSAGPLFARYREVVSERYPHLAVD